jgi:hypothetical protein
VVHYLIMSCILYGLGKYEDESWRDGMDLMNWIDVA